MQPDILVSPGGTGSSLRTSWEGPGGSVAEIGRAWKATLASERGCMKAKPLHYPRIQIISENEVFFEGVLQGRPRSFQKLFVCRLGVTWGPPGACCQLPEAPGSTLGAAKAGVIANFVYLLDVLLLFVSNVFETSQGASALFFQTK